MIKSITIYVYELNGYSENTPDVGNCRTGNIKGKFLEKIKYYRVTIETVENNSKFRV